MRASDNRAHLSEFDRENIDRIMGGEGTNFSAQLLRLMHKADRENLARLRLGFPEHVEAFERWMAQ